jgi:hypothetical protein
MITLQVSFKKLLLKEKGHLVEVGVNSKEENPTFVPITSKSSASVLIVKEILRKKRHSIFWQNFNHSGEDRQVRLQAVKRIPNGCRWFYTALSHP